ncbi:YNFM family putative membrane transporter [Variovorax boronicumulans]|uniref:MFS transporter n=1 Tax=Variovorax boronicumulans TaxID=436515 RepID=UPI00278BAC72|nr:MFS transporter [Variovorax boronicumulans]MDQ0083867.1 YNFM family putative membrane transporter [Variovorax boronicumulans]
MSSPSFSASPALATRGSAAYRRISFALFFAGFATFSLLYCVQPLLPVFAQEFGVSPAGSSLALSLTTGFLALSILCASALSEAVGRRGLMFASMCGAAVLTAVVAIAPTWHALLLARAVGGLMLGGVPAVAMAYLAEEIEPDGLGLAMGLYVGGTAFGGMVGRVGIGMLTDLGSWRVAMATLSVVNLLVAVGFVLLLPASRNFVRYPGFAPRRHIEQWLGHLRNSSMASLFLIGFLVMGAFVTVYNYAGFRLTAPPYRLSQTQVSLLFAVYLFGIVASSTAGAMADRLGRRPVLITGTAVAGFGVALTLLHALVGIALGVVLLTIGFFIAHSVASAWVGRMAAHAKGHAASLYLLAYYGGSSLMGSVGGWAWTHGGWSTVTGFTGLLLAAALMLAMNVERGAQRQASVRA